MAWLVFLLSFASYTLCGLWFAIVHVLVNIYITHFGPMVFCFFGPMVIFIYLFSHLVFHFFGPLDSVYWSSSNSIKTFFNVFVCKRVKPCTVIRKASLVISPIEMIITYFYSVRAINIFIVLLLTLSVALNKQFCILISY